MTTDQKSNYENFTQLTPQGENQRGAEFTLTNDRLFLGKGGNLILSQGCEVTALFDEVKLTSLELTLFVDEDSYRKLHLAFDYQADISRTSNIDPDRLFKGKLQLDSAQLLQYAKKTAPVGEPIDRLIELLKTCPELTQRLDAWEFRGARPTNSSRPSA